MTTAIQHKQRVPVRFRCFLDEVMGPSADLLPCSSEETGRTLIVDPSFQFQLGVTIPLSLVRRARFRERFLSDYPLAWIEDPATHALRPFWIRHQEIWALRALAPGREPSIQLSSRLQRLLSAAGILVTEEIHNERRLFGETQAQAAVAHFAALDYCLLSDLIHPAHLRALGRYYRDLIAGGYWQLGDAQVKGRYGWYNEMLACFFHHQLTRYVGEAVGMLVKPSYAYVSAYQGGAVLDRHLDREQCEFTMSLLIERTYEKEAIPWPLYFDTSQGKVELFQSVGDAVLFRGTRLPHYRPPLAEGQTYTSLLFHYVPADFTRTLY
jgi:hypothetical protein